MKRIAMLAAAVLLVVTGWSAVAQAAAAKKKMASQRAAAVAEARRLGLPVVTLRGCVKTAPPACKYVEMGGVKHSVAVKSEVWWLWWLDLPSYPPTVPGTEIIAEAVTLNRGSINCGPGVTGNIVVAWVPTRRACPAQ